MVALTMGGTGRWSGTVPHPMVALAVVALTMGGTVPYPMVAPAAPWTWSISELSPVPLRAWVRPLGWDPHTCGHCSPLSCPSPATSTCALGHWHPNVGSAGGPYTPNPCPGKGRHSGKDPAVPPGSLWVALGWHRGGTWHPRAVGDTGKGQTCPGQVPGRVPPLPSRCWQGLPLIPMAGRGGDTPVGATHVSEVPPPPLAPPLAAPGASGSSQNSPSGAIKAGRARRGGEKLHHGGPWPGGGLQGSPLSPPGLPSPRGGRGAERNLQC